MLTNCKNSFFSKKCESLEFRSFALSLSSLIKLLSFTNVIFSFDFDLTDSNGLTFLQNCLFHLYLCDLDLHGDFVWFSLVKKGVIHLVRTQNFLKN